MNTSQDWDVIWKWHWFRRQLWQPHFRDPEHPEGRHARRLPVWVEVLRKYNARRVLDANCGLGLRTILLAKAGFDVTGTDISPTAVTHAKELAQAEGVPLSFDARPWSALKELAERDFDAVLTDAMPWVRSYEELFDAFRNFAATLRPGGVFVFTGIDEWTTSEDRLRRAEHAWKSCPRFQIRANYGHGGTHMTLVVARDREGLAIVENFLFVIHQNGTAHLETAEIRSTLEWSWADLQQASVEAGFQSLSTIRVTVAGRDHHVNVALK